MNFFLAATLTLGLFAPIAAGCSSFDPIRGCPADEGPPPHLYIVVNDDVTGENLCDAVVTATTPSVKGAFGSTMSKFPADGGGLYCLFTPNIGEGENGKDFVVNVSAPGHQAATSGFTVTTGDCGSQAEPGRITIALAPN